MYLKNIHLRGFKSFGVKSSLVFEPGISIIVGPNGSGKSNIVDAISWVLGEQSPKSLRSSSMGDIIFKSKNEELAIAEVSLVFDNTERTFPLDFAEVKFTRRTYIKGGSEYFINSSPCRLADIQDLIAESGIGRGLYTIINQGQINNVILNKPSDRKHIIDEIIGVSRHKIRRDKSRVKLDFCENDISRINDLLHEVKRTMDPLAVEAQKSKLFFDLSQEIKYEEISLFIANMNNLNKKWDEQLKVSKKNSDELIEIDKKIYLINSQKKEFENFFYQERESFNELENSLNAFNLLESRLKNLESIAGSQQISVETIINMINFSIKDLSGSFNNKKEAYNRERQIKEETEIKSLIKKVDELLITTDELFKKLSNWVSKSYINDLNNYKDVILDDIHSIKSTLDSLDLNSCVNEIKKNDDIGSKNEIGNRISIEQQLKNLKEIKKYSELNIYNLKLLKDKSDSLLKASVRIKNDITIKISSQKEISGSNQIKLNKYNEELNKLSSKKSFLENEIYRSDLKKEQIREKVKDMSTKIFDEYNMAIDYIMKNFNPSENIEQSQLKIRNLRGELQKYKNVNPNAHIEFEKVKERFEFLQGQKNDLAESKKSLEKLIVELNLKIMQYFNDKFNEINENFKYYFKMLFPLGNGELLITEDGQADDDLGIDISADIGNNKSVALQMLSGGEKALISIAFLFSIFAVNSSPFYIFDEIDAALDDANLNRFMTLARIFAQNRQVIIITHQKKTMEAADIIYGFTMQSNGITKIVSEKIKDTYVQAG